MTDLEREIRLICRKRGFVEWASCDTRPLPRDRQHLSAHRRPYLWALCTYACRVGVQVWHAEHVERTAYRFGYPLLYYRVTTVGGEWDVEESAN